MKWITLAGMLLATPVCAQVAIEPRWPETSVVGDHAINDCAAIGAENATRDVDDWMWFCMHQLHYVFVCVPGNGEELYFSQCWYHVVKKEKC
jgi:hypothetical protein